MWKWNPRKSQSFTSKDRMRVITLWKTVWANRPIIYEQHFLTYNVKGFHHLQSKIERLWRNLCMKGAKPKTNTECLWPRAVTDLQLWIYNLAFGLIMQCLLPYLQLLKPNSTFSHCSNTWLLLQIFIIHRYLNLYSF